MTAHGWSASSEIRIRRAMGAAMTPRRSAGETSAETDQAHWGRQPPIGVGNLPTPMLRFLPRCAKRPGRSLPQCTVSYPNALNALAVPCPNTPDSGAPPLRPPTPTHRFLPQCTGRPADRVGAQVRARLHAPIRQTAWSFPTPRSATDHQCRAHGPTAPRLPPSRRTDRRGSR